MHRFPNYKDEKNEKDSSSVARHKLRNEIRHMIDYAYQNKLMKESKHSASATYLPLLKPSFPKKPIQKYLNDAYTFKLFLSWNCLGKV
jgi:hypothetical protein